MKKITDLLLLSFMLDCQELASVSNVYDGSTDTESSSGVAVWLITTNAIQKTLLLDSFTSEGNSHLVVVEDMVILKWELTGDLFEVTTLDQESKEDVRKETIKGNTYLINSLCNI